MPTIYDLKPRFQNLPRPAVGRLAARGVSANQVTIAALGLSLATGLLVAFTGGWQGALLLVPVVLFVRMALNAIDGMLAREHDLQTPLGAILNELDDVFVGEALYGSPDRPAFMQKREARMTAWSQEGAFPPWS